MPRSSYGDPVTAALPDEESHRARGEEHEEIGEELPFVAGHMELEFAAAADHVAEHLVEGELVLARPARDDAADVGAVLAEEGGRRRLHPVAPLVGEEALQV